MITLLGSLIATLEGEKVKVVALSMVYQQALADAKIASAMHRLSLVIVIIS